MYDDLSKGQYIIPLIMRLFTKETVDNVLILNECLAICQLQLRKIVPLCVHECALGNLAGQYIMVITFHILSTLTFTDLM